MSEHGKHPFETFRPEFESLDWSRGLDVNDLRVELRDLPPSVLGAIPDGHRFHSFDEFWSFTRNAPSVSGGGLATGAVNVGGTWATELDPEAPPNSDL